MNKEELGNLMLTAQEVDDIVAFMMTLTDGYVPPGK
jgi:cytochrome c peroxidase